MATPIMTVTQRQGLVFSILALLTCLVSAMSVPIAPQLEMVATGLLIVLLGVPHGALDPLYAQAWLGLQSRSAWLFFFVAYVLLAACVVVVWWYLPTVFLLGFLAVSALHFSGDLDAQANFGARFFYGGAPLVLPAGLNAAELERLFTLLAGPQSAATAVLILHTLVWPWLLGLGTVVLCNLRQNAFVALELLAVSALSFTASPLWGFTIFFCGMHSPRHILRTQKRAGMAFQSLAAVATLPMLGVVVLGAVAWYALPASSVDQRIIQLVFVALAALTVPHMILVERVRWVNSMRALASC